MEYTKFEDVNGIYLKAEKNGVKVSIRFNPEQSDDSLNYVKKILSEVYERNAKGNFSSGHESLDSSKGLLSVSCIDERSGGP